MQRPRSRSTIGCEAHPSRFRPENLFAKIVGVLRRDPFSIFPCGCAKPYFCEKIPQEAQYVPPAIRCSPIGVCALRRAVPGLSRRGVRLARARPRWLCACRRPRFPWPRPSAVAGRRRARRASAAAPPLPPARLRALRPASLLPSVRARGVKPRSTPRAPGVRVGDRAFASRARAAFAARALCGGRGLCGSSGPSFRLMAPRRSCASAEAALVRSGALRVPLGLRLRGPATLRRGPSGVPCADVAGAAPLRSARPLVGRTGDQRLRRAVKGKSSVPSAGTQNKPSAVRAPCRPGGCVAPPPGPPASADTRSWSAWP